MSRVVENLWFMVLSALLLADSLCASEGEVIFVQGAAGTEEYAALFSQQAAVWRAAAEKAGVAFTLIGQGAEDADGDLPKMEVALKAAGQGQKGRLWLVLAGHGTFDGREAKFNLRGPDLTPALLAGWLAPLKLELVFIHTGSASGAFLKPLAAPGRTLVTATKSGDEVFYARFGEYFAPAIAGLAEADLDQDRQVSVLEAFLYASQRAAEFYQNEERLATEHALLEDNGDGTGTRAEVYEGTRAVSVPEGVKPDGARAAKIVLLLSEEEARLTTEQRARRDVLETRLEGLKEQRSQMPEEAFFTELEKLLRELAKIYE